MNTQRVNFLFLLGFLLLSGCGNSSLSSLSSIANDRYFAKDDDLVDDGVLPEKWNHVRDWDLAEEERYSHWVELNFTTDFLVKRKLWADCADTEMVRRAWYAIKRGLPFGYRPIYDVSMIISSLDFANKKPIEFIKGMGDAVSTENLALNSYQIRVAPGNKSNLKPGIFNFFDHSHTQPIAKIDPISGLMIIRQSTLTTEAIVLMEEFFLRMEPEDSVTLRRQYTPVVKNRKMDLVLLNPDFEQKGPLGDGKVDFSKIPLFEWIQMIYLGLQESDLPLLRHNTVSTFANNLKSSVLGRVKAVEEGYKVCRNYTGSDPLLCVPGHDGIHSTPNRDLRLSQSYAGFLSYLNMLKQFPDGDELFKFGMEQLENNQFNIKMVLERNGTAGIPYELKLTLKALGERLMAGMLTADPKLSIQERWGENLLNITSSNLPHDLDEILSKVNFPQAICSAFQQRNSKFYVLQQTCNIPGYERLCQAHIDALKADDLEMVTDAKVFMASKLDLSADALMDMKAFRISGYFGFPDSDSLLENQIPIQRFLANLLWQCQVIDYNSGTPSDGGTTIPIPGGGNLMDHYFKLDGLRPLESEFKSYNLREFVKAYDEGKVVIGPNVSGKELWGGEPSIY